MGRLLDLTGKRFKYLIVIERAESKNKRTMWRCRCDCGGYIVTRADALKIGDSLSCGCYGMRRFKESKETHKLSKTRVYHIWENMKQRCLNKNKTSFHLYGGRGITLCEEWMVFQNFYDDMGLPNKDQSIDRIDNEKGYSKVNCRWATPREQSRNKRTNILIEWDGEKKVLSDWADFLGIKVATLYTRVVRLGWDIDRAFNEPVKKLTRTHKET